MKFILLTVIRLYKLCISPLVGQACRFTPTCSSYAKEAIEIYGARKGSWMAIKRICRCNPRYLGGHDPVIKDEKL